MGGELDAELRGSSAGLARIGGVGADKRGSCLVEGFCRVGLLHRVIADREGVKLALHDGGAGRKRDKQIGTAIARATDAHHRETIGYEERGNKPLVVRTGVNGREAVAFFEVAAVLRGSLAGVERGAKAGGLRGAAVLLFSGVDLGLRGSLPEELGRSRLHLHGQSFSNGRFVLMRLRRGTESAPYR